VIHPRVLALGFELRQRREPADFRLKLGVTKRRPLGPESCRGADFGQRCKRLEKPPMAAKIKEAVLKVTGCCGNQGIEPCRDSSRLNRRRGQ
jgi:hypothetical protein